MLMKRLVASAATAAIALSIGAVAHAQSTATQAEEVVVTGHRTVPSTGGLATQVNEAKDESIIQAQFIATQLPSSNVAQLINMLPGVSWSTEDPAGLTGGDLRIHGFDGAHVAFILDGAPLNDTGNYAVYPGEYIIGELLDHITVNIGSSDVDSPSAAALGATINVVSKKPSDTMGGELKLTTGSFAMGRAFGEFDTGAVGPWGTKAWVAIEDVREDNYEHRPGSDNRQDISGRIYQPLKGDDFLSVAGNFTKERLYPPFDVTSASIASNGIFFIGDNYTYVPTTATAGKADTLATAGPAGTDANYYRLFPNPVDFASVRGQSKFTLGHGLTFTFDPSFFYTLANGGGGTSIAENSPLLRGGAISNAANAHTCVVAGKVTGVDLNGDGDCLDTAVVYAPSNTQTYRYGLTSSLLYDLNEHHHFQLSYTGDYGLHRQTGEYAYVDPTTGDPSSVFGGKGGYGTPILNADGAVVQKRNRRSIAILNQVAVNYIGKYLDDRLHINVGVRLPFFERDLNNYCDTYNGTTVFCSAVPGFSQAALQTDYNADLAANRGAGVAATALTRDLRAAGVLSSTASISTGPGGVPEFRFPFNNYKVNYNKVLPNAGLSYRIAENNLVYVSYAGGFTAPKTDDLYSAPIDAVKPETSDNFAAGYRYQTRALNASFNLYDTEYHNRIEQTFDPTDPTVSIDRNVGDARVYGLDMEAGLNPIEHLHLYASANFNHSELLSNYYSSSGGVPFVVPSKGKKLLLTPDRTFAFRASYDMGPITVGLEGKYISRRFISDINDVSIPAYGVFNFDARYNLPFFNGKSYVQFNIQNLFNKTYFSRATTPAYASYTPPEIGKTLTSSYFYYVGAPTSAYLTLNAQF